MMLRWMCFLVTVAVASCQLMARTSLESEELDIERITQIMSSNDPSGRNHSIRLTTSEHRALDNVTEWVFLQHTLEGKFITYTTSENGENPSLQTEFIFHGNLLESNSHLLKAKDESQDLAMDYNVVDIEGLKSKVTWVGENKEMQSSSLRVVADTRVGDILVNQSVCTPSDSPCYYIKPDPKPSSFKRCVNVSMDEGTLIEQCDERVRSFKEMQAVPSISLREDRSLEIEFIYQNRSIDVEVVAYDPDDHNKIFSSHPYKCRFMSGKMWEEGEKMSCRRKLQMPEDQLHMMVLIVIIDEDGDAMESTLQYFDTTTNRKLSIEKISKIMMEDDPSGKNYNTRVMMSHQSLSNIKQWKLNVHHGGINTYEVAADGSDPSTQTTIIFEENLGDANAIMLSAINSTGNLAAVDYIVMDIEDMQSRVAWVGADSESESSSLRVVTGPNFDEIEVGHHICKREGSPCYFTSLDPKPKSIERCSEKHLGRERIVEVCDERVIGFSETSPKPSVTLRDDGKLAVEFALSNKENFRAEVVAYDSEDQSHIYSDKGHRCLTATGVETEDRETMTCLHSLTLPDGQNDFMVLVVKYDEEGRVITSSVEHYGSHDDPEKRDDIGVIVGAVIGAIIGVALIAFLIIFCMKKRKESNDRSDKIVYQAAPPSDKVVYQAAPQSDKKDSNTGRSAEEGKGNDSD